MRVKLWFCGPLTPPPPSPTLNPSQSLPTPPECLFSLIDLFDLVYFDVCVCVCFVCALATARLGRRTGRT